MRKLGKARKYLKFSWKKAPDIQIRAEILIEKLSLNYINAKRIFFYRSDGSKARAYARTWGLPALWQNALKVEPGYIIEVISKHFDNLPTSEQDKVLLHEISHIPKTFSGALTPHTRHSKGSFYDKLKRLYENYSASR